MLSNDFITANKIHSKSGSPDWLGKWLSGEGLAAVKAEALVPRTHRKIHVAVTACWYILASGDEE